VCVERQEPGATRFPYPEFREFQGPLCFYIIANILYTKWNFVCRFVRSWFCPTYIFGRVRIYGGSVFCSVRAVAHQRGEEVHGNVHGHGHHEKDARRDTNSTPTTYVRMCCCELIAHSAPKTRIARAPELAKKIALL